MVPSHPLRRKVELIAEHSRRGSQLHTPWACLRKQLAAVSVSSSPLGIRLSRAAMSEKLNRNEKIVLEHYPCMVFTDICEYVFFWKFRQQFNMNYSSVLATFAICYFYIYVCLYIVVVIA